MLIGIILELLRARVWGISWKKNAESELNASYYTESIKKIPSLIS